MVFAVVGRLLFGAEFAEFSGVFCDLERCAQAVVIGDSALDFFGILRRDGTQFGLQLAAGPSVRYQKLFEGGVLPF